MFKELKSKLIDGVFYSTETQRLTVHLANGHRREYVDVPQAVYEGLLTARSAGEFYKSEIKPNFKLAD